MPTLYTPQITMDVSRRQRKLAYKSKVEGNAIWGLNPRPLGFLFPRLKWAAKFSSEVEAVEHAEHKKGIQDRDFQVTRRKVALSCPPPPSFPPRHQPCLQTPATPAKIGPNSTTVELNSLKFKWEMSFHWSCKYWKWAGLKIGWMCVMHLNPWSKERFPLTNQRLFCFPVKFVKQSGRWAD